MAVMRVSMPSSDCICNCTCCHRTVAGSTPVTPSKPTTNPARLAAMSAAILSAAAAAHR